MIIADRFIVIVAAVLMLGGATSQAHAQQTLPPAEGGCEILVQFYNLGTPGTPGVSPDGRFGVRLNVEGSTYAVLPADRNGFVRFYGAVDHPVAFSVVPLYMSYGYTQTGFSTPGVGPGDQVANCGYNGVKVFAGT